MSDPTSEPFVHLCLKLSAYAKTLVVAMQGENNDVANALLHSLALFLAVDGSPEDAEEAAKKFAAELPDLAKRYASALQVRANGGSDDKLV